MISQILAKLFRQTHVLNGENEASDHGPVPNFQVKMIPSSFYVETSRSVG